MSASDGVTWHPFVKVLKFDPDTVQDIITTYDLSVEPDGAMLADLMANDGLVPDNITEAAGNALVTVGKQRLSDLITGTGQAFTTTRGMVGVGDSSTATTAGMTSLQAGTNTYYQALDGAPGSTSGVITASSTFGSSNGTYAWNEWCWCIATATPVSSATFATATTSGIMVNRAVQSLGTKGAGAIWTLQGTVTLS